MVGMGLTASKSSVLVCTSSTVCNALLAITDHGAEATTSRVRWAVGAGLHLCSRWNMEPRGTYCVTMLSLGGLVQAPMNSCSHQAESANIWMSPKSSIWQAALACLTATCLT